MEIGDTFEVDEAVSDERPNRTTGPSPKSVRRKNGRNGGKGRDGKQNGGRNGNDADDEVSLAGDGRIREVDLRRLLAAMRDLRDGDFEARLPYAEHPLMSEIADAFNGIAKLNESLAAEMIRVSTTIGREGQMTERASLGPVAGGWQTTVTSINSLITDLVSPTSEVARVLTAVAEGDLSQKMVLEIEGKSVQGEFLRIGTTVNTMVDQLGAFADEVTRVAREVGTEGKLGGQAQVPGVA